MTRLHVHIAVEKRDDSAAERITTYAAGSHPQGAVHPLAIATPQSMKLPVDRLRNKSWQEFAQAGSPPLDFVFTVDDHTAGEVYPVWPGKLMIARLLVLCVLTGIGVMAGWW